MSTRTTLQNMQQIGRAEVELRRNPKNIEAMLALADALSSEKQHGRALEWLNKALSLARRDKRVLARLVAIGMAIDDLPLSRRHARKLVEVDPRDPAGWRKLGLIHEEGGNAALALEAYTRADALEPCHAPTLHDISRALGNMGRHAESLEFSRRSLAADPTYSYALYAYANARRFQPEEVDPFIADAEAAIARPEVNGDPTRHANLLYAIGKVLDDAGRTAEAFPRFAAANRMRAPASPSVLTLPFENTRDAFPARLLAERAGQGDPSTAPIFVFGMPRSGTTLVESLIGAHSAVTAGDELLFANAIGVRLGRDSTVPGAYRRAVEALSPAAVAELGADYLARTRELRASTPRFTDKLPHNFMQAGLIALILPGAPLIHCRRHPLDTCLSLFVNSMRSFHNDYKTDLTRLGLYYRQYWQLTEHWRTVLGARLCEVYYEDVVANTELNARALIAHCGLPWEDGVLSRADSQRSVRTLSGWQVRQPIYASSQGRWRRYEDQLGPLIEILAPITAAYEAELAALAATGEAVS